MKTLYVTRGSNIMVDQENNTADRLSSSRNAIEYIYLIKEPIHVVYGYGEYKREVDAEPGDIVVTFYDNVFKNQIVVVKNADWVENLTLFEKEEQEEKERWAAAREAEPHDN